MSTDYPINRLGFTEIPRQDVRNNPAAVMVFVHGLRGNPQTTWSKSRSSARTSQSYAHKSKSNWFRRNWGSQTQNKHQLNAPGSTSAPPPLQAISAGNNTTYTSALPTPSPVPSSSSSTEFCWPRDGLSKKLPNVQILLYGYEADMIGPLQSRSQNTITTHGNNFLIALERKLPKNVPLIFVAHSLGGILVKDVLSLSKSHLQRKYTSIHSNTRRIVFMGTPHQGSDLAGLAIVLANITKVVLQNPNKDLLRGLDRGSEVLDRIHTSFKQLLVKPDFDIHCFQEDRGVTWVPGLTGLVVDYQSSKTGSPHETCETIAANHIDMVAYSGPEDDNYRQVSDALVSFVEEIIINASPPVARQPHMDTWTSRDTNASEFLAGLSLLFPGLTLGLPRSSHHIAADELDMRGIEWFSESPEFNQWNHESGLLWLSGGPGSGKTTLSFYLWDSLKRNHKFATNEDIAVFFMKNRSAPIENQVAEILSAIVYQLLQSNQERLELVIQKCPVPKLARQPTPASPTPSLLDELWDILFISIMAIPTCPTTLIIDGLDQLGNEVARQTFCNNLLRLQIEIATKGIRGFKIFITARPYNDIKKALAGVLTVERDKERQQCLQALRFDELNARRDRVERAHEKTGEWLRDDAGYKRWNSSHNSGLLLIRGKPGSGKSTLAKFIVNLLKSQHGFNSYGKEEIATEKTVLIADFFYSFRGGKTETSHRLMLQSLLHQLLSQDNRLFSLFRDTFRARKSDGHQLPWEWNDLRKVFASLGSFKACEKIYILVDAMDESDEQGRPEILKLLMKLCSSTSGCAIKALIATRPLPPEEIDERLSYCYPIVLQERNQKDIENVIISGIQEIRDIPDSPSFDLGFIKNYMIQNADGVFLWVALVFRELKELVLEGCSQIELEACLNTLPTELEDMYRLIIRRLFDRPKHQFRDLEKEDTKKKKGVKMLNWATFAQRPLTIEEFRDAIAIPSISEPFNPEPDFLSRNRIDGINHRIRACCGSLLEIRGSVVQLLHQTARDFLLQKDKAATPFDIDVVRGDTEISSVSIRYLRLLSLRAGSQAIDNWNQTDYDEFVECLRGYSLLEYVVSSLPHHLKSLAARSLVNQDLSSFLWNLQKDKVLFCFFESWTELLDGQQLRARELDTKPIQFRTKSLIAAARSGYAEVVKILVQLRTDINGNDEASGMFALRAAAENGHLATVRVILEIGADVNAQNGQDGSALQAASAKGHEQVIKLLFDMGADVNAQGGQYGNALQAASAKGHEQVIKLLLDMGADVNAQGGQYGSALQAASAKGHEQVIKLLLDMGADVNVQGGQYGNALEAASAKGHEQVIKLLLGMGADVNAQGG